jgi:hypothetical protein
MDIERALLKVVIIFGVSGVSKKLTRYWNQTVKNPDTHCVRRQGKGYSVIAVASSKSQQKQSINNHLTSFNVRVCFYWF